MSEYFIAVKDERHHRVIGPLKTYREANAYKVFVEQLNKHEEKEIFIVKRCFEENEYGAPANYPFPQEGEIHGD